MGMGPTAIQINTNMVTPPKTEWLVGFSALIKPYIPNYSL